MKRTLTAVAALCAFGAAAMADSQPNILVIVADDLGYTDLSLMGGEIATPNIDAIAQGGTLFTDYIVAPNCSPTRAMLLSGTDSHLAGLGLMAEMPKSPDQENHPGYLGYLNESVHAFPRSLQNAGYQTFMAGKWHLGSQDGNRPESHGFDHSFALMQGGASHFADMSAMSPVGGTQYFADGQPVAELPADFFSSDFYTDQIIDYISAADDAPFFGYLAYTAPHWPLQAPDAWIEPFEGKYDAGYEVLKDQRIQGLIDAGLFPGDAPVNDFKSFGAQQPWDDLTDAQRRTSARAMEIYAGMVANLDWNIGRVIDHLKETGEYDDTLIIFMSDNGAEGGNMYFIWDRYPDALKEPFYAGIDNSYDNLGKAGSFVFYDAWGQAGVGPFRDFKSSAGQGGVRTFMMVKPTGDAEPVVNDSLVSVMDIAPTLLDIAGAAHPDTVDGAPVLPHLGKSLTPILAGQAQSVREEWDIIGSDLLYNRALRMGDWRIVWNQRGPFASGGWQLFDLANDPAETRDLAADNPDKLAEMLVAWDGYVAQNKVIIPQRPFQAPQSVDD